MGLTLNHRAGNQEVIEEELMIVEQHYPNTGICSATNGLNAWLAGWLVDCNDSQSSSLSLLITNQH